MKQLLIIGLIALAACSEPEVTIDDPSYSADALGAKSVALVDNSKITRQQLDHALAFYSSNPMVGDEESRITVLNEMIEEQVLFNQAIKHGFDKSPEYLNNQRKLLAHEYRQFLKQKVAEKLKVNDLDLQIFYDKNIEKYTKPAMNRIAIYLQRSDIPNKPKLSLKQVKEAAQYLKPQQGFGKYALESHHSKTANRSGKLPWISSNSQLSGIPQAVLDVAQDLEVGEVSDTIKTDIGTFLVRLMATKPQSITPLEEIKASLRQELVANQKENALQGFIKQAKNKTEIEILKQNLGKTGSVNTSATNMGPPGFPVK